ncbi:MAG: sigma-70 family RNA polymerase sigma factor [Kutzneria sp.]|nr:sigma-70 family RNA polymerase sigma factor [Kutzneria sp.]MBV9847864.1 sigma-70 family RNA polymerase sigma factor [Kutzneria sp.]
MAESSHPLARQADDDRALLDRLRSGDDSAFGLLFSRHAEAVRGFAVRQTGDLAEAEDLTAEVFFRVFQALRRGSGPTDHVRTYLLTVARRVSWEWCARHRDVPVDDEELSRRTEPCTDSAGNVAENHLITQAFTSLPERWRTVLWQVEVEGERPASVGPSLGLTANATAALARRARAGLRAAYLQAHLAGGRASSGCRSVRDKLGGYTAGTVSRIEGRRIRAHLLWCTSCQSLQGELRDVCSGLRAHAGLFSPFLGKSMLFATRAKLALTAAGVTAVGVFGVALGPWLSHSGVAVPAPSHDQNSVSPCMSAIGSPSDSRVVAVGPTDVPVLPRRRSPADSVGGSDAIPHLPGQSKDEGRLQMIAGVPGSAASATTPSAVEDPTVMVRPTQTTTVSSTMTSVVTSTGGPVIPTTNPLPTSTAVPTG